MAIKYFYVHAHGFKASLVKLQKYQMLNASFSNILQLTNQVISLMRRQFLIWTIVMNIGSIEQSYLAIPVYFFSNDSYYQEIVMSTK